MKSATDYAIGSVYNPTDVFFYSVASNEATGYFDAFYGTSGNAVAWTACAAGASYVGLDSSHTRDCDPDDVRYNLSYTNSYNNVNERKAIACQETGHIFGLRHNYTTETTCMNDPPGQNILISGHEVNHLNANY